MCKKNILIKKKKVSKWRRTRSLFSIKLVKDIRCYQNTCAIEQKSEPGFQLPRIQRIQWSIFKLWFNIFFYIPDLNLLVQRTLSAVDRIFALVLQDSYLIMFYCPIYLQSLRVFLWKTSFTTVHTTFFTQASRIHCMQAMTPPQYNAFLVTKIPLSLQTVRFRLFQVPSSILSTYHVMAPK